MPIKIIFLFSLLTLTTSPLLFGQVPITILQLQDHHSIQNEKPAKPDTVSALEICNNGIDDDGNGLVDKKDFACYFGSVSPDTCIPTKVLWAIYVFKLYWVDLETNAYRIIDLPSNEFYDDITWTPDGKLYGVDHFTGEIREINPYTGQTQFKTLIPGHYAANGMTSDASGNLYLQAYTTSNSWHIVKLNLSSGQATVIADLSSYNLSSAGDLTFVNGFLYATCENNKIAKIDINTGSVLSYDVNGPYANGMGLVTLGDGYLYTSGVEKLYRVDPATMTSTLYYTFPTYGSIRGLTSYSEFCNAPGCRSSLNIDVLSSQPYCSNTGVLLKGKGNGITVPSAYTWTLPGGQTKDGDSLVAFTSGTYTMRYHTVPDTCGSTKSITLNIINYPKVSLGNDTLLCSGANAILLNPSNTQDITSYLWQDGSVNAQYQATQPGLYWLQSGNICGTSRDSVQVIQGNSPQARLEKDTSICAGVSITLANGFPKKQEDIYLWSTGQNSTDVSVNQPGIYWLESVNACGIKRDSILIVPKDSCTCHPFFPKVNLGVDNELCTNKTLQLTNSLHINGFVYTWQDGTYLNDYTVKKPGTYWVDVTTYCGSVRDTVIVKEKTEGCICSLYFPTAFSPNGNGRNDVFKPLSTCPVSGEMSIYNRWGQLVFATSDLQKGWNGFYKGTEQVSGVYLYNSSYKFPGSNFYNIKKGTLILLR